MRSLDKSLKSTFHIFLSLTAALAVAGCITGHPTGGEDGGDLKHQIMELQKNQGKQTSQIEELNNKILLLKDQLEHPLSQRASQPSAKPVGLSAQVINPQSAKSAVSAPVALAPLPAPKSKEHLSPAERIYEQALVDSRKPQLVALEHDVDLLLKGYRDSPVTNNALYLYADILFSRAQYGKSAEQFERLYKLFPDGNKAVAALYSLGLCYQKMGHPKEAGEAFQNVVAVYPGSREAVEAQKQILNGDSSGSSDPNAGGDGE